MSGKKIWVICDSGQYDSDHVLQLINKATQLAQSTDGEVWIICIGEMNNEKLDRLGRFGGKNILFCNVNATKPEEYADIIGEMIEEREPNLLIYPATVTGKAMAARLSSRFEAGLTADCIDIDYDQEGRFVFSRAAMNESVIARIICTNSRYEMCTVKENVFQAEEKPFSGGTVEIHNYKGKISAIPVDVLEKKQIFKNKIVDLNTAKVVFAVGRGVKGEQTLLRLQNVAKRYNAEIIGTRAAVEEGMIEYERQVGQSGISLCPDIYVGFGISGASQHMVGIKNAKCIIAVNKDEEAPIFQYADYSIVEDVENVLKELESA